MPDTDLTKINVPMLAPDIIARLLPETLAIVPPASPITLPISSNPGAAASLLASDASGGLQLVDLRLTGDIEFYSGAVKYAEIDFSAAAPIHSLTFNVESIVGEESDIYFRANAPTSYVAYMQFSVNSGIASATMEFSADSDDGTVAAITAQNIELYGEVFVSADLNVSGNISAEGTVTGINFILPTNAASGYSLQDNAVSPIEFIRIITTTGSPSVVFYQTVYVNDTSNAFCTLGLTINQGANDDEILSLKSSDVAHGATFITETDTFAYIEKYSATEGGFRLEGISEVTVGANISGYSITADTTKTTTSVSSIQVLGGKVVGGALGASDDNQNVFGIQTVRGIASLQTIWLIDKEGTIHILPNGDSAVDLITVQVTGTPTLAWDEANDIFTLSKGISVTGNIYVDHIEEKTAAHGVVADGVTLKDGGSLVVTGGTNTFNMTNGTAILDVAAGSTVNVDASLTITTALTNNGAAGTITWGGAYTFTVPATGTAALLATSNNFSVTQYINDTSDAWVSKGLVINQGAADDYIITLKNSDVAHGMTSIGETDTFGFLCKADLGLSGGVRLGGLTEATIAIALAAYGTTADATKATSTSGYIHFYSNEKSGTSIGNTTANAALFTIMTYKGDAWNTVFIVDEDGDIAVDGSSTVATYDEYDDVGLLTGLRASLKPLGDQLRERWADWINYAKPILSEAGIVTYNDDTDGVPFISLKGLHMLEIDAIRQLNDKINMLTYELEGTKEQLKLLIS